MVFCFVLFCFVKLTQYRESHLAEKKDKQKRKENVDTLKKDKTDR